LRISLNGNKIRSRFAGTVAKRKPQPGCAENSSKIRGQVPDPRSYRIDWEKPLSLMVLSGLEERVVVSE
jgi:hypothetical protein